MPLEQPWKSGASGPRQSSYLTLTSAPVVAVMAFTL